MKNQTKEQNKSCLLAFRNDPLSPFLNGGRFLPQIKRIFSREDGPTSVEYAVLAAVLLIASILAITALGQGINNWCSETGTFIETHGPLGG